MNATSCAYFFNDKEVDVSINSNPSGADIFIEGKNYGKTPATIHIIPKSYNVSLVKEGHGSTQFQMEWWQAIREKEGEGGRCLADALGTMLVLPAFSFASVYCREFKQKEYFVDIPYLGAASKNLKSSGFGNANSMLGISNQPANMIDYYYNQEMINNSQNH